MIQNPDAASPFAALYAGLLGRENWILVEIARTIEEILPSGRVHKNKIPGRITIRKTNGRALINEHTNSPVEIPYCTLSALIAEKLISFAGRDGDSRHIYRSNRE